MVARGEKQLSCFRFQLPPPWPAFAEILKTNLFDLRSIFLHLSTLLLSPRPRSPFTMAADADRQPREVKNHLLFEIATEVAPPRYVGLISIDCSQKSILIAPFVCSRWYLLGHQVQGSRHDC